jgi:hypothetical protein
MDHFAIGLTPSAAEEKTKSFSRLTLSKVPHLTICSPYRCIGYLNCKQPICSGRDRSDPAAHRLLKRFQLSNEALDHYPTVRAEMFEQVDKREVPALLLCLPSSRRSPGCPSDHREAGELEYSSLTRNFYLEPKSSPFGPTRLHGSDLSLTAEQ